MIDWALMVAQTVLIAALVFIFNRKIGKRMDEQECATKTTIDKQIALESGMRSVIRSNIIQSYDKAIDRGYIPPYERESILSAYHDYKVLQGNGMVDHLMDEMAELGSTPPIKIHKPKSIKPKEAP